MHSKSMFPLYLSLCASFGVLAQATALTARKVEFFSDEAIRPLRYSAPRVPRGRGKQAKSKRRPNRLHISKRVRRAHRRAA